MVSVLNIHWTDAEAETPIIWPPDVNSWFTWKDPDAGKDWKQEEKGTAEDKMFGWHHWLWTWVWASSGSWRWTGRPGVLQSMGSQRVRHNWATELNKRIVQAGELLSAEFHWDVSQMWCWWMRAWLSSLKCCGPNDPMDTDNLVPLCPMPQKYPILPTAWFCVCVYNKTFWSWSGFPQ